MRMAEYTDVTVDVVVDIDTYIYSRTPNSNYGNNPSMTVGGDSPDHIRRILMWWDVSGVSIPSDIDELISCVIQAYVKQDEEDRWHDVHFLQKPWKEIEATWINRLTSPDNQPWATPGGDFDSTALASLYMELSDPSYNQQQFDIASYFLQITDNLEHDPTLGMLNFLWKYRFEDGATFDHVAFARSSEYATSSFKPRLIANFRDWAPTRVTSATLLNTANNKILIDWSNYTEPGDIATYKVYRETDPISDLGGLTPIQTGITNRYWEDTPPLNHQKYYYCIEAIDTRGNSFTTNMTDFTITTDFDPSATSVTVTVLNSRKLRIDWVKNEDGDFQKYELWRDTGGGFVLYQTIMNQDTITYEDTVVNQGDIDDYDPTADTWPDGRTVSYFVRVYDTGSEYADSNEATGTTRKPIQPLAFSVSKRYKIVSDSIGFDIAIDWAGDTTDEDDYQKAELRYLKESNSDPDHTSNLGGSSASYPPSTVEFFGLDEFTKYKMIVVAYDDGGLYRYSTDSTYNPQMENEATIAKPSASILDPPSTTVDSGEQIVFDARQTTDPSSETASFEDEFKTSASLDDYNTAGSPTIVGEKLQLDNGDLVALKNQTYFGEKSRNYVIDVNYSNLDAAGSIDIAFRNQDVTNLDDCYLVKVKRATASNPNRLRLLRVIGGTPLLISEQTGTIDAAGHVVISLIGDRIRVYYKDEEAPWIDSTNSQWDDGSIGFENIIAATQFDIDDVTVYGKMLNFTPAEEEGYNHIWGDGEETGWGDIPLIQRAYYIDPDVSSKNYTYKLYVTNKWGCPSGNIPLITFTVNNTNPVAIINGQTIGFINEDIFFDGSRSSDPEGGSLVYRWDWDDGSAIQETATPYVSHQFTTPNNPSESPPNDTGYAVKLQVKDEDLNFSSWVTLTVYIYDTGDYGYPLTILSPFEHIGEIQPDGSAVSDSPNLDFSIIHQLRGGSKVLSIRGIHHDPDESHSEATRITNMRAEADLCAYLDQESVYVKLSLPVQAGGDQYGFIRNYRADLDQDDNLSLGFNFNFVLVTTDQITEM